MSKNNYSLEDINKANMWFRSKHKGKKTTKELVYLSSGVKVHNGKARINGMVKEDMLGSMLLGGNIVEHNNMVVALFSCATSGANGTSVNKYNFSVGMSLFAARRLITGKYATWINGKDEYMVPNVKHELYKQWENDCIVYSLFNTSSNQSSLRNIEYKDKVWDIHNHFFFMSKDQILQLATNPEHINNAVEQDIYDHGQEERYVYTKIKEIEDEEGFSPDAQAVLDKARELVKSSFKYREIFNMEKPEYNINTWDAGWYQIKGLLKEYDPKGLKEFTELYKGFEDRMRPLVYELGFLYE